LAPVEISPTAYNGGANRQGKEWACGPPVAANHRSPIFPAPGRRPSAAQLAQEINFAFGGTSANSNSVQPLDTNSFSDPPTLADLLAVANKLNELIVALRR
jgi:hypothetical protein